MAEKWGVITVAFAVLVVSASVLYWFISPFGVSCEQIKVKTFVSPSGQRSAAIIRTNCGATTNFRYSVAVIDKKTELDISHDYFFSMEGSDNIEIIWNAEYSMTVKYPKTSRVFRKAVVWRGEAINYEVLED